MYLVRIYRGAHYSDPVAHEYRAAGSLNQIREGARAKVQQLADTRNRRTWVDVFDLSGPGGSDCSATHYIFDEGTL